MSLLTVLAWNRTAFEILDFSIQWYAIFIAAGALVGYLIFKAEGLRMNISEDNLLDMIFYGMIFGLIGARLYYVLFSLDNYLENPLQILNIRGGGMAIYGGVIGGMMTVAYLCRKRNLPIISVLDAASPGMLIAQAIGRWGNFVNQEAHGDVVQRSFLEGLHLPDWMIEQMNIQGSYYHPTFLYESFWNVIGFIGIMMLRHRLSSLKQGDIMAFYLVWYGIGRAVIEGMRTDSLYFGPLRVSQWLSMMMVVGGIVWMIRSRQVETVPSYQSLLITKN